MPGPSVAGEAGTGRGLEAQQRNLLEPRAHYWGGGGGGYVAKEMPLTPAKVTSDCSYSLLFIIITRNIIRIII